MQDSPSAKVDSRKKAIEKGKTELPDYQFKLPYPAKIKKDQQQEKYKKLLHVFKTLNINVLFVEALAQMPRYAKFLKELFMNKRKLEEVSTVTLSEKHLAIISKKIPRKEKDPGGPLHDWRTCR